MAFILSFEMAKRHSDGIDDRGNKMIINASKK